MNIQNKGTSAVFKWTKDYLFQVLTGGKSPILTNPKLIAAFRAVDRADFVPPSVADKAYIDMDIDVGYGEQLTRATFIGTMLQHLNPKMGGTYLDIGTGTGYAATILSAVAGKTGKIYSIERIQWLWEMARDFNRKYRDIGAPIQFLYRDGKDGLVNFAPFDGIHVAFGVEQVPENLKMQLSLDGGILVIPTLNYDIRVIERRGNEFLEEIVPGVHISQGKEGTV